MLQVIPLAGFFAFALVLAGPPGSAAAAAGEGEAGGEVAAAPVDAGAEGEGEAGASAASGGTTAEASPGAASAGAASAGAASPAAPEHAAPEHVMEPLAPRHRLTYQNVFVLRANPLGLEDRLTITYQRRLWKRHGALFEDAHIGAGPAINFAPSIARVGAFFQAVPLAILHLRAAYYFIGYFGDPPFKAHPFTSPNDEFGPDQIHELSEMHKAIDTYGGQAEFNALLQGKVGPVAIRNETSFFYNQIKLPGASDVFYDLRHDLLLPGTGWFLGNDSDILYVNDKHRFTVGARGTVFHVWYPDWVWEPGDARDDGANDHARVGPLFAYRFKDRPQKRFMRPTLYVLAQWWVKHRYRTGQQVNQGIPLVVIGFSFTGDLWKRD